MTHFYKTNFSLVASLLLLCLAPMVAGADKTIWQGESGDLNIRWTEADITATAADGNVLFSARALAEEDFKADFLTEQSLDKDNPCEYERSFTLLSVVGDIASLEDTQYVNCQSMPHPSVETRFMAIDLAQSGQVVKLTDFFTKSGILRALLADAVIKNALKKSGAKTPATLTMLYEALEWTNITVINKECKYRLAEDFLSRFAFHHVKKNKAALRFELPPIAHVCNSTNIQLGFYLPIPSVLKKAFDNAKLGRAGFLMEQHKKMAGQKMTKVSFSTKSYFQEKVGTTEPVPVLPEQVKVNYHTVVSGETLYGIAKKYAYSVEEVATWNDLQPPYSLSVGQKLQVSVSVVAKWTRVQKDTIHQTLPEFVFKLIGGKTGDVDAVGIKAIEIYRDNKSEPFQTLEAGTPVSELKIEDLNFDSYKDIRLMAYGGVNTYYSCWLFEQETEQFVFSDAFSEIALLEVDAEKQLIKSTWNVNAADHEGTDFYKVIDNKPVLVKREEIYLDDNQVKVVVQERVGDKMKIVSEKSEEPVSEEPVSEKPVSEKPAKELVKQRIMIASGVNVRSAAKLNARRVGQLNFGTVVKELARSKNLDKIGNSKDYWYQIEMPSGETGWTFGNLSTSIDPNKRGELYLEVAQKRLKKNLNWSNQKALLDFLARAKKEVQSPPEIAVELALLYFSTLQKKLDQLFSGNQQEKSPYREWLNGQAQQELIFYNKIGDNWIINVDVYWQLHNAYYPLPVAERIAWVAANAPLGGECEGFLGCALDRMNHTSLKYLKYHPTGEHVEKVIDEVMELLNDDMVEVTEEDVALPRLFAVLQSTVERTNHPDKSEILHKIKERQQTK